MKITQVTSNVEKQQISLSFDAPPWTVRNSNVELGVKAVLEELPYFIEIISVQWNDVGYIVRLDSVNGRTRTIFNHFFRRCMHVPMMFGAIWLNVLSQKKPISQ